MAEETVCCVCMSVIQVNAKNNISSYDPSGVTVDQNARDMLDLCVPELNLQILTNTWMCSNCHKGLCIAHKFKNSCLNTQKTIEKYLNAQSSVNHRQVELLEVLNWLDNEEAEYKSTTNMTDEDSDLPVEAFVEVEYDNDYNNSSKDTCFKSKYRLPHFFDKSDEDGENTAEEREDNSNACITLESISKGGQQYHFKPEMMEFPEGSISFADHMKKYMQTDGKRYKCLVCEKQFTRNEHVHRHMLTHTGLRPFKCEMCPKQFSRNEHLQRHMFTHTGEKRYECLLCMKRFSRNEHLRRHMIVHVTEKALNNEVIVSKLYVCDVCKQAFDKVDNLKMHKLTHLESDKCNMNV